MGRGFLDIQYSNPQRKNKPEPFAQEMQCGVKLYKRMLSQMGFNTIIGALNTLIVEFLNNKGQKTVQLINLRSNFRCRLDVFALLVCAHRMKLFSRCFV